MQGILLDRQVSVYRKVLSGGQYKDTPVYPAIRCAIVPISKFDAVGPYAYESTHLVWVPYWLALRKEDQIRDGRRPPNPQGDSPPSYLYTINGRREFKLGVRQVAYYAREMD